MPWACGCGTGASRYHLRIRPAAIVEMRHPGPTALRYYKVRGDGCGALRPPFLLE
jgi:hypothetical protein